MNFELIKNEFIKIKKEELNYIDYIAKISSTKIFTESEKLKIYRTLNNYKTKLDEILKKLKVSYRKSDSLIENNFDYIIIEFEIEKNYLSSLSFCNKLKKKCLLENLMIDSETLKFKFTLSDLKYFREYKSIDPDVIQNNQRLIDDPIYIFCGYYDSSEDCFGPCFGKPDDYIYGIYENMCESVDKKILKKEISEFEKNKTIIYSKRFVSSFDIKEIFEEELLNINNKTIRDCVNKTKKRIEELNYTRSPEYKEKVLLDRINELYKKVKGEFIQEEILYNGNFLQILNETYRLPNKYIISKEKIIKNNGKDSVIVVAITQDNEYIITIQNRINDKLIAEFPSGYIENNETPLEAAKRELMEETGYISDDLFLVDEAYPSLGIDNSKSYIVIANNCIKTDKKNINTTEFVDYGLFSEKELKYLINKNIMNGALNKLAYYNIVTNLEDCAIVYLESNKKIYKKLRNKTNPFLN